VIGLVSGSLALISDAVHNFTDVGSLTLSWWGEKISSKAPTPNKTYGFKRAEVLIAFINSLVLLAVVVLIAKEAIIRLAHPEQLPGGLVAITATIALLGNGLATLILKKHSHDNLNMKSAWLHSFQDAIFSLGVIVGAILIYFFHWNIIDPIISILLSIFIAREAYKIIKNAINILMESVPNDLDMEVIRNFLQKTPGVESVHDLHIWQTDTNSRFLSVHIVTKNLSNTERAQLLNLLQKNIEKEFKISHTTIQMLYIDQENPLPLNCNHCN
jgi:cobalt-zinc-cadmium efflux system protein